MLHISFVPYTRLGGYDNGNLRDSMTLSHTILILLCEEAQSGYDLSKRFEDTVSYFWKASHQQIYRELSKMEGSGFVASETIPQQGKPDKKLYQITEAGRKELEHWFELSCTPTPIREDLLVKVLAGPYIPKSILVKQLEERRSLHQNQLDSYLEQEKCFLAVKDPDEHLTFRYLTLRRGIRYELEWVDWCNEVLATLP
jgi:DNA-binding PadR family transcriptional regulator